MRSARTIVTVAVATRTAPRRCTGTPATAAAAAAAKRNAVRIMPIVNDPFTNTGKN